jgi:mannan endo-1,4-beta-mannosidase
MPLLHCLFVCLHFWLAAAGAAGTNPYGRNNDFVSVHQGSFQLGGRHVVFHIALRLLVADVACSPFRFYGTNAYWLQMITDADMDFTLHDIATAGFNVVRAWAFNDVAQKPSSGPYFQVSNITSSL